MKLFLYFVLLYVAAGEIIGSSKFSGFRNNFREDVSGFLKANPTGRPGDVVKFIHNTFKEHAKNLMEMRPTGRPMSHDDHKDRHDHHKAMWQLHKARGQALRQAWLDSRNKSQQEGDETEIIGQASKFAGFHKGFRADVSQFLKARPTGRPQDILKFIQQKYRKAAKELQAARPTGRPSSFREHVDKSDHEHAVWKLATTRDKAIQQAKNWLSQLRKMNQQEGDETEILSPMKTHLDNFKSAMQQFRQGSPDAPRKEVFQTLDNLYDEHHDNMKKMRPTGRPTRGERKAYWDAIEALNEAYDEVVDEMEEIRKQKLIQNYKPHLETFQEALEKALASKEGMSFTEMKTILSQLRNTHAETLDGMRPTGRPHKAAKLGYQLASEELRDAYRGAQNKLKAWKKKLDKEEQDD